ILDRGRLVALDRPEALCAEIGGDIVSARSRDATSLGEKIAQSLGLEVSVLNDEVRIEHSDGAGLIATLLATFPGEIDSVTIARPTLEDVFIAKTGHRLDDM